ncbi:MAG: hypothetical protein U9P42_07420 [Candidatus Fermentibacteria bacterium]|nr:hypothetical protein [Candidatus Fermentibacteria bacterium]
MTEKVISLSGGLALGMVFALFLGIGVTQSITPSSDFQMPSILQMTIAQHTRNPATHASDTTPTVNVATPNNPDRGRITRIATLTTTTDPVFETTATTNNDDSKDWEIASTPKIESSLLRNNLQRSYIALNTSSSTSAILGQTTTRESNFTAIAANSAGRNGYNGGHTPSFIHGKPQTQGSPAIAQNPDPGGNNGDDPATYAKSDKPGSGPDSEQGNNNHGSNHNLAPDFGGGSENDPGSPQISPRNPGRPAFD